MLSDYSQSSGKFVYISLVKSYLEWKRKQRTTIHGSHTISYRHKLKLVSLRNSYGNLSCVIGRITFKIITSVGRKSDVEDITGVGEG